ncbi:MAG: flagellar export protein FliJ [Pseudomonadota bacterium]
MTSIQPLLMLLESAERARDEAIVEMEGARKSHEAARQQAQSLADWRKDYQQRWNTQFSQSGGMEIMRCYQEFSARLGNAVDEQDKRVEQARVFLDRCRVHLLERERKAAAVGQLIDRRQRELALRQQRQEQKATDEQASRAGRGSAQAGMLGAPTFVPTSY